MEQYIEEFEKSKLIIYTVIIGGYDTLKEPEFIDNNCDYICFTDNHKLTSNTWQIRLIKNTGLDNTRFQRMYKVLSHRFLSEYEYSIYIDGNVRIIGSFRDFIKKEWKGAPLLGLKHPSRDNIYDEAEACINFNKDDPEIIKNQIERYKNEGYKAINCLIASGILFRRHMDKQLIKVMEDWWEEIRNNSRRDQLSFCYVCWKNHFAYDVSELKCYRSQYWLNPGIHTNNIRDVEIELIDHIQLIDYHEYLLKDKDKLIAQKEQEKNEAIDAKEREFADTIALKEREFADTIALKEQEFADALTLKEQEKAEATALKEQEKVEAVASKERELGQVIALREQQLEQERHELGKKIQEVLGLKAQLEHMEHTLSWRYTAIFRKIFIKRK